MLLFLYGFNVHHSRYSKRFQIPKPRPHKTMMVNNKGNATAANTDTIKMLPKAIIIGVRKGGTRALLRALSLHPNVHTAPKEIHFFDRDQNYAKGLEWYRNMMPKVPSKPGHIVMEKSPSYFVTPLVPQRIYKMSRSTKLIVVVRNPTVRAISDYTQLKSKNSKLPPFEQYVTKDKQQTILKVNDNTVDIGLYGKHLKKWLLYFPISQIHFVCGEELSTHPLKELKAVEQFLNLDPFIDENDIVFNKTKGFPCFKKIASSGSENFSCLGATKGRRHPKIRKDIVDLLQKYYEPFNKLLYRMVNRDFHWK